MTLHDLKDGFKSKAYTKQKPVLTSKKQRKQRLSRLANKSRKPYAVLQKLFESVKAPEF